MPFLDLADRVREVRERIDTAARRGGRNRQGKTVTLVAVTKGHGPDVLVAAWDAGLRDVGENRVQEALDKMDVVPPHLSLRWHLIGHLQRNKVKHLIGFHLLHSLDRAALADAVQSLATATNRSFDVLVQVNAAAEETKGGYEPSAIASEASRLTQLEGVCVRGVMTMAPFHAPEKTLRRVFSSARDALAILQAAGHAEARELSMGMSDDYEIAVEEGSTCVRLGTVLFGPRQA